MNDAAIMDYMMQDVVMNDDVIHDADMTGDLTDA
jgi:hypothetical protein